MHLEGVKNGLSAMTPPMIVVEVALATSPIIRVTMATSPTVIVKVAIVTMTSIPVVKAVAIRSAPIQTTVTRVVTVNKLFTLLIEMCIPPTMSTSLSHSIRRRCDNHQQTNHYDSKQFC
jgi:hypothetical protein